MRIVFFGTPVFAVPSLHALASSPHEVVAVVTQPDRPRGRGQRVSGSPVKDVADALSIPVRQPDRMKDAGFVSDLRRFEADLKALREAQRALDRGSVLGMFPEGTRSKTAALAKGEPGTAVIALRTGAQILPVAIWGTENLKLPRDFFRRNHIYMSCGEPFRLPGARRVNKHAAESGTREIMMKIAELLPEKFRGVYADSGESLPAAATTE
jgi:1-acyl-sn-glycerol-3-phosphate acyltransferase